MKTETLIFLSFSIILLMVGCSDLSPDDGPGGVVPPPVTGMSPLHSFPTWSDSSTLFFKNSNISVQDTSGQSIDEGTQEEGIVQYDGQDGHLNMIADFGHFPNAVYGENILVCNLNYSDFLLIIEDTTTILSGAGIADHRIRPSISCDGSLLVFEVISGERQQGLWVDSLEGSEESRFLGDGRFQATWHPLQKRLLYTTGFVLCEYNWETSVVDTLLVNQGFTIGVSAYSPMGDKIAVEARSTYPSIRGIFILDLGTRSLGQKICNHDVCGLSWGDAGIVYCNGCSDRENLECGVLWIINPLTLEYSQYTSRYQFY